MLRDPRTFGRHTSEMLENPVGPMYAFAVAMRGVEKRVVYILRSDVDTSHHYVGITNDIRARLEWHNHGPRGHTTSHRPWSILVTMEFPSEQAAARFEKYLKSGSGRAFAKRHFAIDERLGFRNAPAREP